MQHVAHARYEHSLDPSLHLIAEDDGVPGDHECDDVSAQSVTANNLSAEIRAVPGGLGGGWDGLHQGGRQKMEARRSLFRAGEDTCIAGAT